MNYKSLYFLLIFLCLYGCGSSEVPVEQLTYKNGLKVLKESGEPFTGNSIRFVEDGSTPIEIIEYKNGKLAGNIQIFYSNGELKENFYGRLDNKFYMIAQAFDMNERSRERGLDELDKVALESFLIRYGEEQKWYKNGKMQSEGAYSEDGSRRIGDWQQWYQNGEVKEQGEYSSDLSIPIDKVNRRYNSKVTGIKIDEWNRWYESGVKSQEIIYDNNKKESVRMYCNNNTLGFELKTKGKYPLGEMKIWACDGTEFIQHDSANKEIKYAKKKKYGSGFLVDNVLSMVESGKYNINADDYYKKSEVKRKNGQPVGLMTEWDEDGRIVKIKDYNIANFIDFEYLDAFLQKGRFGSYYKINYDSKNWPISRFNFKNSKPDIAATKLYLDRGLVDPAKKIAIKHSLKDIFGNLKKDQGISRWTYPIIVAPEALFDVIRSYPGVKLDSVDSEGQNRLHLCTILMLGNKPSRCSFEHFQFLANNIPVNTEDNYGMATINYITDSFHKRRSVRSRRRKGTDNLAIKASEILVKAGADVNHLNKNGQTPLMMALSHQEYKIAKALLDLGANVNVKDKEGHNALYFVFFEKAKSSWAKDKINFKLSKSRKEILTALAEHSIQIDALNLAGKSVKDIALKFGAISVVQFLESLSEVKPIAKITPLDVQIDQNIEIKEPNKVEQINTIKTTIEPSSHLTPRTEVVIEPIIEENVLNQEEQLYQKALGQIKRSRLSKPKGDSALDTLNQLSDLTSNNEGHVIELRQKIVDKYLSLARGRINDYRYQDAIKFIKISQRIKPTKKATQLMVRVNDKIAEEALFQQQQQQKIQPIPRQKEKSESGFRTIFQSIFN